MSKQSDLAEAQAKLCDALTTVVEFLAEPAAVDNSYVSQQLARAAAGIAEARHSITAVRGGIWFQESDGAVESESDKTVAASH